MNTADDRGGRLIVLIGEPGVGKTTIGRRLAVLLNARHIEMSELALQNLPPGTTDTIEYVNEVLWADGDYGKVARFVQPVPTGATIVVTGPRRIEEIAVFRTLCSHLLLIRLVTPIEVRAARSTRGSVASEFDRLHERANREGAWGILRHVHVLQNAVTIVNIGSVASVASRIRAVTEGADGRISEFVGDERAAWIPEFELRFLLPADWTLPGDILRQSSDWLHVTDEWFIPRSVSTFEAHEEWFRSAGASPIRIRSQGSDSRAEETSMQIKKTTTDGDLRRSEELILPVRSAVAARQFLMASGQVSVARVSKARLTLESRAYTYFLDDYGSLGRVLEVELDPSLVSDAQIDSAEELLPAAIRSLPRLDTPIALQCIRQNLRNV